jgi:PAS domain S-box-containing protein
MRSQIQVDPARLEFRLPLDASRLMRVRERLRDYLVHHMRVKAEIDDVVLAIEEACTNVIRHSGSSEGMTLSVAFESGQVEAIVTDWGMGFDPDRLRADVIPSTDRSGGRGLFLMASLMDDVEISVNDRTEVRMKRRVLLADHDQRHHRFAKEAGPASLPSSGDLEERLFAMLQSLPDGFVAIDWEWRYIYVNPAGVELLHRPLEELLGAKVWDLFPESVGTPFEHHCRRAMEQGVPTRFEFYFDPHRTWYELRVYPTASGISVYFNDISDRKGIEREREALLVALEASEARFRATFEQAAVGMAHVGIDGRFLLMNDQLCRITGYSCTELAGLRFQDITHPDDLGIDLEQMQRLLGGEIDTYTMDKRYVRKDGSIVWISLTGSLVRDEQKEPDFFVAVIKDIQERKRWRSYCAAST